MIAVRSVAAPSRQLQQTCFSEEELEGSQNVTLAHTTMHTHRTRPSMCDSESGETTMVSPTACLNCKGDVLQLHLTSTIEC